VNLRDTSENKALPFTQKRALNSVHPATPVSPFPLTPTLSLQGRGSFRSVGIHSQEEEMSTVKNKRRQVRSWSFIRKREIGTRSPDPDQSFPGIGESMPIGLQKNRGSKKIYRKEAEPPAPAGPR